MDSSAGNNLANTIIRVIGIGQPFAGDDGVGYEIAEQLKEKLMQPDCLPSIKIEGHRPRIEVLPTTDSTILMHALENASKVIIIDAVKGGGSPGDVLRLTPEALRHIQATPVSTHGISVINALEISKTLMLQKTKPEQANLEIVVIGVVVESVKLFNHAFSESIIRVIPKALQMVFEEITSR